MPHKNGPSSSSFPTGVSYRSPPFLASIVPCNAFINSQSHNKMSASEVQWQQPRPQQMEMSFMPGQQPVLLSPLTPFNPSYCICRTNNVTRSTQQKISKQIPSLRVVATWLGALKVVAAVVGREIVNGDLQPCASCCPQWPTFPDGDWRPCANISGDDCGFSYKGCDCCFCLKTMACWYCWKSIFDCLCGN